MTFQSVKVYLLGISTPLLTMHSDTDEKKAC